MKNTAQYIYVTKYALYFHSDKELERDDGVGTGAGRPEIQYQITAEELSDPAVMQARHPQEASFNRGMLP